jgi:hypothetical protein|tara:strand:+ start:116 stop:328 length:213 start_codon:yes stop_codon:yes gene_type:complete
MMGMKKRIGKRGGGGVMKKRMKKGGDVDKMKKKKKGKKKVDAKKNPGLAKLPKSVRNKMGYMKRGGKVNG